MRDFYYVDDGGILSYPDGRPMSPADAAAKINRLVQDNTRYRNRLQIDLGGSDRIDELQQSTEFLRHEIEHLKDHQQKTTEAWRKAEEENHMWRDASGLESGGDPDGVTPAKAKKYWDAEAKKVEAFQAQAIEHQADVVAYQHDIEVAEHERDQARKELEDWKRLHSQPIHNPPEATGEYVDVMGEMIIPFTVQLPVELCREPIACDDPAIEAALQAVSGHICTYIWGEDKKPAVVYCDVGDQNVEIESDDRECLEKDSTRLTDNLVNSGTCSDGDLAPKRKRS